MSVLGARLFARSLLLQAGFSDRRRQGLGFAYAIDPALAAAYAGDAAGLSAARLRHLASFNVQPHAVGFPLGAAAALEAEAAAGRPGAAERAVALKGMLGACLSGAADGFFWGALRPLSGALAILVGFTAWRHGARHPLAEGAAAGLLAFNVPALAARGVGLARGLSGGESCAAGAAALPAQRWIRGARWTALVVVVLAAWSAMGLPEFSRLAAAAAFAAGAALSRAAGGPLRLAAAAGLAVAAGTLAGWAP